MTTATEEVTKAHLCGNCERTETAVSFLLPENWVEVRVRSGAGIHLDTEMCWECKDAINSALANVRTASKAEEPKAEAPEVKESVATRQAARRKRVTEVKEETAAVEANEKADTSVVEGDIQENSVDSVEKTD